MIAEDIIWKNHVKRVTSRDSKLIYDTQAQVIRENLDGERNDNLANFISKMPFSSMEAPGKQVYYFRVLKYLRFLDIRYSNRNSNMALRRNLALYNRVIWGVLYRETMPDIRYGLTKEMREAISTELQQAVAQK